MRGILQILYRLIAINCPRSLGGRRLRAAIGSRLFRSCGRDLVLERGTIPNPRVSVGNRVQIGASTRFMIGGGLTLGDDVLMAPEVVFVDVNHRWRDTSTPIKDQGWEPPQPIKVGAGAWIGIRAVILPGVEIGEGAIIGAGSVVTHSIPPMAIAMGNPAVVKKFREDKPGSPNESLP